MALLPPCLSLDQEDITRRLLKLQELTGYDIVQRHGQRIYGGPPPGWSGPPPDKGTEVYIYRIPRDCFEDELVPVFNSIGKIYELRLMIEFSGTNRSYCYVRYTKQEDARDAIRKLNNYQIREGYPLAVTRSVDNKKLCVKTLPPLEEREEDVALELKNVVEGVTRVVFQSRGWLEVEFVTHRLAALARRQLVPGNVSLFARVEIKNVDWADPEEKDVGQDTIGRVLCVRNLPNWINHHKVGDIFNNLSDGQVVNAVRSRYTVLVTFITREGAKLAMDRSINVEIEGNRLNVSWWINNKRLDKGQESNQQHSVPTSAVPSTVEQLYRVCTTQGWGAPHYSVSSTREDESAGVVYQCGVMVFGLPGSKVMGECCGDIEVARVNVASKALQGILQSNRLLFQPIVPSPAFSVQVPSPQMLTPRYPPRFSHPPPRQTPPGFSLSTPQYRPGSTFSLFPPTTRPPSLSSAPRSPKPVQTVNPVTRDADRGMY